MSRPAAVVQRAGQRFAEIDGAQRAAAFAYYSFFAMFPFVLLLVSAASTVMNRAAAGAAVITYIETYIPISGIMQSRIFDTLAGVVAARGRAGVIAFLMLIWVTVQVLTALISATNRAWNTDASNWWRLPLKSLVLLCLMVSVLLLGLALPVVIRMLSSWYLPETGFGPFFYALWAFSIPMLVVFASLSLFYKLAPRRSTRLAQVWRASLCATILLRVTASCFVIYLRDFAKFNALYGAFGAIMALLLWVYLSGCVLIFGACLCAARTEILQDSSQPDALRCTF